MHSLVCSLRWTDRYFTCILASQTSNAIFYLSKWIVSVIHAMKVIVYLIIQIRLPNGRVLRQNFAPESKLRDVWSYVTDQHPWIENMCLMQVRQPSHYRYMFCDGSDRIQYETMGNRRGSWHMTEIEILAIHRHTLHVHD